MVFRQRRCATGRLSRTRARSIRGIRTPGVHSGECKATFLADDIRRPATLPGGVWFHHRRSCDKLGFGCDGFDPPALDALDGDRSQRPAVELDSRLDADTGGLLGTEIPLVHNLRKLQPVGECALQHIPVRAPADNPDERAPETGGSFRDARRNVPGACAARCS